jgi:hypothetical protein
MLQNDIVGICHQLCDVSHFFVLARWEGRDQLKMTKERGLIFIGSSTNPLQTLDCFTESPASTRCAPVVKADKAKYQQGFLTSRREFK